ncbi:MAG: Rossmann-like and DUF2520 domain-containing protein [Bacteroidota bacterium]
MKPFNVSIVGAGHVGTTLAVMLHRRAHAIVSVVSRSLESAHRCARLVDCRKSSTDLGMIAPETELLILAVPDEELEAVAAGAAERAGLNFQGLAVFHTSGIQTSDLLAPFASRGSVVCSIHPIQTFATGVSVEEQVGMMKGISYGIEGSEEGRKLGERVVEELEGTILVVPKEEKISYHLACVLASNFTVALLGAVEELAAPYAGGVPLRHFRALVESSIANAVRLSSSKALTGPIARGSVSTVEAHLGSLQNGTDLQILYSSMALWTIELALRGKRITPEQAHNLKKVLSR